MRTFHTVFDRTLTSTDAKQNIPFPVPVPPGTTQLHIGLTFTPWTVDDIHNLITLTVLDTTGFRGAGHRHGDVHEVVINAQRASPGYRAGAIQAGEWTVIVDTHMVMPGPPCEVRLEVWGTDEPPAGSPQVWEAGQSGGRGRGWYRGDLHAHSIHSDARWDIPDLVEWARETQLDFCTLSDHNTVSGLPQADASRSLELLVMGGMELTTFCGHALALGVREWVDWRASTRTMEQIAGEVQARDAIFIIAHPRSVGDPHCTGCRWVYDSMMPGNARAVEVWNDPWSSPSDRNEEALGLAFDWLNQGYRLALTAGTDHHGDQWLDEAYGFNVVYADDLSELEILRAVRAGHLYLSSGPHLELTAMANGQTAMMGDSLPPYSGIAVQIQVEWGDAPPGAQVALIVDGVPHASMPGPGQGSQIWKLARVQARWCLATLRAGDGRMLALTNPIYLDGRS